MKKLFLPIVFLFIASGILITKGVVFAQQGVLQDKGYIMGGVKINEVSVGSNSKCLKEKEEPFVRSVTISGGGGGTNTVDKCNNDGPFYGRIVTVGAHVISIPVNDGEKVGWTCYSTTPENCPVGTKGEGNSVSVSVDKSNWTHVWFYIVRPPTPSVTLPVGNPLISQAFATTVPSLTSPPLSGTVCSAVDIMTNTLGNSITPIASQFYQGDIITLRATGTANPIDNQKVYFDFDVKIDSSLTPVHSFKSIPATLVSGNTYQASTPSFTVSELGNYTIETNTKVK